MYLLENPLHLSQLVCHVCIYYDVKENFSSLTTLCGKLFNREFLSTFSIVWDYWEQDHYYIFRKLSSWKDWDLVQLCGCKGQHYMPILSVRKKLYLYNRGEGGWWASKWSEPLAACTIQKHCGKCIFLFEIPVWASGLINQLAKKLISLIGISLARCVWAGS